MMIKQLSRKCYNYAPCLYPKYIDKLTLNLNIPKKIKEGLKGDIKVLNALFRANHNQGWIRDFTFKYPVFTERSKNIFGKEVFRYLTIKSLYDLDRIEFFIIMIMKITVLPIIKFFDIFHKFYNFNIRDKTIPIPKKYDCGMNSLESIKFGNWKQKIKYNK